MKGISNLITAVLLVAIAVSIATIYSSWAPDFAANVTSNAVDQTNQEVKCRNAGLSIEDPVYDNSVNETLFDVVNSGNIRFSDTIEIIAFKSSVLNRTSVQNLEVGESVSKRIPSSQKPNMVLASISECPSLDIQRTQIRETN